MAETLGMLCDKLTIVKLKQYHTEDATRLASLAGQEKMLQQEIDEFVAKALAGEIPQEKLSFAANKVFKAAGNDIREITGSIGVVFADLADVNCKLWHEQEKVYDFENVPVAEKDVVVRQLAHLNLERNKCIDEIDRQFATLVKEKK
ncbi:hypothetical protein GCM10023093_13360 [Nemorincola caseinilytica]|uniref:Uncharacterized protein n=1 Tax=Nemorincola caseinilytica TaxID=2054315 RepID=A0ABP8NAA1_9BACT